MIATKSTIFCQLQFALIFLMAMIKEQEVVQAIFTRISSNYAINRSKLLGQGAFGKVYQGLKKDSSEIIAVKIIQLSKISKRQIQMIKSLQHHSIVCFYGHEVIGNQMYFYFQYCPFTLQKKIKQKSFDEDQIFILFKQLLEALTFIHKLNVIHRDLKPANILISREGNIKIADFGLSKINQVNNTLGAGTPKYRAPQVSNGEYDMKCDIWSLGLILYQMLKGKYLFQNVKTYYQLKICFQKLKNEFFDFKLDNFDPFWKGMIRKMLTFDKDQRSTLKELLDEFYSVQNIMSDRIQRKMAIKSWNRQESFDNLNNLRIYWNFWMAKNNLYEEINNFIFDRKSEIQQRKRKLIFYHLSNSLFILALSIQYRSNLALELQLKDNILILPNTKFHTKSILPITQGTFLQIKQNQAELIKQKNQYLVNKLRKGIKTLLKIQLPQGSPYTKVIDTANAIINNTVIPEVNTMKQLYIDLLLLPENKLSEQQLKAISHSLPRIYFLMHAVIHLSELIEDQKYSESFYLINKKEELYTLKKEQMSAKLQDWIMNYRAEQIPR